MDVTTAGIRALLAAEHAHPVTTVFLNTDGARFPKPGDYEARLDGLLRDVRKQAEGKPAQDRAKVLADADAIGRWVRTDFDRGDVRGIGVFASGGQILETVQVAVGVRNIARVNDGPYVVPLEALLGRNHHLALALVQRDKARIFRSTLGRTSQYLGVEVEVQGRHDQGGWSQGRFQRSIESDVLHHFKDTAEILRKLHEAQPLDALVISGSPGELETFVKTLHPSLRALVHTEHGGLPPTATPDDVRDHLIEVEQELVSGRRAALLDRLASAQGQAEKAARGIRHVLEAVNTKRVEVLFVVEGAGEPGYRSASGALALHEADAAAYGTPVEPVEDLVDEIIEDAVRSGAHIELFRDATRLDGHPVAALLRF